MGAGAADGVARGGGKRSNADDVAAPLRPPSIVAEVDFQLIPAGAGGLRVPLYPVLAFPPADAAAHVAGYAPTLTATGAPPAAAATRGEGSPPPPPPGPLASALTTARAAWARAVDAAAAAAASAGLPWPVPASPPAGVPPSPPPLAWHPARPRLAAADGVGRVAVFDLPPAHHCSGPPPAPPPTAVLAHAFQRRVTCLAWRPCAGGGSALAVGCEAGTVVWAWPGPPPGSSGGGRCPPPPPPPTARFFPAGSAGPVSALAWSPCGRLLAVAGGAAPAAVCVWEAARGAPTVVAAGLALSRPAPGSPPRNAGGHTLLSWSPDGGRLLAGGPGGGLAVWETGRWGVAAWPEGPPGGGRLVGAAWSPAGDAALLAFALGGKQAGGAGGRGGGGGGGGALASLAFTRPPPCLAAHLLPVGLPPGVSGRGLAGLAWAPRAGRLALALDPEGGGKGAGVALLAVSPAPVLAPRLVGVLPVGRAAEEAEDAPLPPVAALADGTAGAGVGAVLAVRAGAGRVEVVGLAVR